MCSNNKKKSEPRQPNQVQSPARTVKTSLADQALQNHCLETAGAHLSTFQDKYGLLEQKPLYKALNLQKTVSYFCTISYVSKALSRRISKMLHMNCPLTKTCHKAIVKNPKGLFSNLN